MRKFEFYEEVQNEVEAPRYTRYEKFKMKLKFWLLIILFLPAILMLMGAFASVKQRIEFKRKYKKIIKKGFFWDTEYYIEKEQKTALAGVGVIFDNTNPIPTFTSKFVYLVS